MVGSIVVFLSKLPDRLRRVTSGSKFIPEIDGLRFLAIFPVVFQHFSERLSRVTPPSSSVEKSSSFIMSHGHIGVYIFFAVSGFILALPFGSQSLVNQPRVSLTKYYVRRLTRLEPPYLISLTLIFIFIVILQHQSFQNLLPHFIASLFYSHRFIYGTWTPLNPPAWTLEVEVQFYLLAPFLTLGYFSIPGRWKRRSLLLSIILLKIVFTNITTLLDPFYLTLAYLFEFFFVGVLVADIFLCDWHSLPSRHKVFDWVTVAGIALLFSSWSWEKNLSWKFVFILALFTTLYGSFRSVRINAMLRNPWITALGGMCYSIYLIHLPFTEFFVIVLKKIWPTGSFLSNYGFGLIFYLPVLLVVCSSFFLLVEKPCMNPRWPSDLRKWVSGKISSVRRLV